MTFTHRFVVGPVEVALVSEGVAASLGVGARALSAGYVDLQGRVSVVAVQADLAVRPVGGVSAGVAVAGKGIAGVSMAVTFAWLKMNKYCT